MKEFTLNTRFWAVKHCKQFKSFKKYVLAPRGDKLMVFRKIKRLNAFYNGQYRVGNQAIYPNPLEDVAEMIKSIFNEAAAYKVSTQNYTVCGFSAGGHLAALWETQIL